MERLQELANIVGPSYFFVNINFVETAYARAPGAEVGNKVNSFPFL